jgi:hypothetical protein
VHFVHHVVVMHHVMMHHHVMVHHMMMVVDDDGFSETGNRGDREGNGGDRNGEEGLDQEALHRVSDPDFPRI